MPPWTSSLCALAALGLALAADGARAQVVFDDTFGSPGAAPTDPGGTTYLIEQARGGTVSSGGRTHVFHSFDQFSVPLGRTAEFRADDGVDSILSRVTGTSASVIEGGLRVRDASGTGSPDLFLLNPNGVLFGGSSRLDLSGALHVSTASFVGFEDGQVFSAVDLDAPLPTTATPPTLLGFAEGRGGDVAIQGRVISNDVGGALDAALLSIVGRNVEARGQGFVASEQATLQIGAVGEGEHALPLDLRTLQVRCDEGATGAIRIGTGGGLPYTLQTTGPNADQGRIVIRGGSLTLDQGALQAGGDGSAPAAGPAIDVEVAGEVHVTGGFGRISSVTSGSFGPGGVRIAAEQLRIESGASVDITTNGADTHLGRIEIDVGSLFIRGQASELRSTTLFGGAGGEIRVDAQQIELDGLADILTLARGDGRGGDITISGGTLAANGFSRILAGTESDGATGGVDIRTDRVHLGDRSVIGTGPATTALQPDGDSGGVYVEADEVRLEGGSQISTTTVGAGDAGDVIVEARERLSIEGSGVLDDVVVPSGIFARSGLSFLVPAGGVAGGVTVRAGDVALSERGEIGVQTFGSGRAGEISVHAQRQISLRGGRVLASSAGDGATGGITLGAADAVLLSEGAEVLSEAPVPTAETGSAGSIAISAGRLVQLEDSRVATDSARPDAGNVALRSDGAVGVIESAITTNVDADSGRGGDVLIETGALAISGSVVTANAQGNNADAGDILIRAGEGIIRSPDSTVEARAELGVSGTVLIVAPETNVTAELGVVSAEYRDPDATLSDPCSARRSRAGSFEIERRPAVIWSPDRPLEAQRGEAGAADACDRP